MENFSDIRKLLRLTQEEMAVFLGISRSHYSMYESGQRTLPLEAMQHMAEIIASAKAFEARSKSVNSAEVKRMHASKEREINRLLHENEYQQALISRKIASLSEVEKVSAVRLHISDFLKNERRYSHGPAKAITAKIIKLQGEDKTEELVKLEIRFELLREEQKILEAKLEDTTSI